MRSRWLAAGFRLRLTVDRTVTNLSILPKKLAQELSLYSPHSARSSHLARSMTVTLL